MLLMPTHPYKQPLGVWINSKQDGDLTNTNSKEKYRIKSGQSDLRGIPLWEKTTGDGEANHYEMKQYKRWEPTRMGRLQISHGFHFLLDEFSGSKPLISSPLPNPRSLQRGRTQLSVQFRVGEEAFKGIFSE